MAEEESERALLLDVFLLEAVLQDLRRGLQLQPAQIEIPLRALTDLVLGATQKEPCTLTP